MCSCKEVRLEEIEFRGSWLPFHRKCGKMLSQLQCIELLYSVWLEMKGGRPA